MTEAADSKAMEVEPALSGGEAMATATTALAAESEVGAAVSTDHAAPAAVEDAEAAPSETTAADAPAAEVNSAPTAGVGAGSELLAIDGIGPKVATILAAAGITTLAELAATDVDPLRAVLAAAGHPLPQRESLLLAGASKPPVGSRLVLQVQEAIRASFPRKSGPWPPISNRLSANEGDRRMEF